MKRVLILTASTGQGHNQVAKTLKNELEQKGYTVFQEEPIRYENEGFINLVEKGYQVLVRVNPKTFGRIYRVTDIKRINERVSKFMIKRVSDTVYQMIINYNPSLIITTHPLFVDVISSLRQRKRFPIPILSIITDFMPHQSYVNNQVDAYLLASDYTKVELVLRGIPEEKIYCYGIPTGREFVNDEKKVEHKGLGILIMGGSMGVPFLKKSFNTLLAMEQDIELTVVCGTNNKLKETLETHLKENPEHKKVNLLGYVNNIQELMDKNSLLITKPGGLTSSEAIGRRIPMLIPFSIPGAESDNADVFEKAGIALKIESLSDMKKVVLDFHQHPEKLKQMQQNMDDFARNFSLDKALLLAEDLMERPPVKHLKDKRNGTNILIITAGFGFGHKSVAESIKDHLLEKNPRLSIEIVDFFSITRPSQHKSMYKLYTSFVTHMSGVYNYFYYIKNNVKLDKKPLFSNIKALRKFQKYLEIKQPSLVVSTFPDVSGYLQWVNTKNNNLYPFATCITDIVEANEWLFPDTSRYFVPTIEVKRRLINKGIPSNLVSVTGIPIRSSFINKNKTTDFKKSLGIEEDKMVCLFMGGGLGLLPEKKKFYSWLSQQSGMHFIILTGKNDRLKKKLDEFSEFKNIHILGFTNQMSQLMSISSLLVTKPGGITIFEAIAEKVPLLILEPEMKQEKENARYIIDHGLGYQIDSLEMLKQRLREIQIKPEILEECRNNILDARDNLNMKGLTEDLYKMFLDLRS